MQMRKPNFMEVLFQKHFTSDVNKNNRQAIFQRIEFIHTMSQQEEQTSKS